jgi:hypothetical protein
MTDSAPDHSMRPDLPGYLVGEILGVGGSGPVWAAVDESDGTLVAVKVVAAEPDSSGTPGRLGSELAILRSVSHPHVVALREDVTLADGRLALVLERVEGGSLERVLRARGHLTAGEASTVLVSLAGTAADLHRLGVTHADLSPGNVLFHRDGRPMLADLGASQIHGDIAGAASGTVDYVDPAVVAGSQPDPASDVYALGALGWRCLTGAAPGHPALRRSLAELCPTGPPALLAAIEAAVHPDPLHRPRADELAWAVYEACRPEPVLLATGSDPGEELTHRIRALAAADVANDRSGPPAGQRRRPPWRWLGAPASAAVVLAVVLVAAAVGLGPVRHWWANSAAPARPLPAASTVDRTAPTWSAVVARLATLRVAAFSRTPSDGPASFDAPGTPAWESDQSDLDDLRRDGLHYAGVRVTVTPVGTPDIARSGSPAGRTVTLRVRVRTSAYDVVDDSGRIRAHRATTPPVVVTVRLVQTVAGWRVGSAT